MSGTGELLPRGAYTASSENNGGLMAKQRPSVQKRQREFQKRERERKKAEKAALKRERRLQRDQPEAEAPLEDAETAPEADTESAGPVE
jgi:hypothetical protein